MSRPRLGTILAAVVVVGILVMWGYLFFVADPDVPDRLDDRAFPEAAQAVCERARDRIDALPPALEATTPEERAATVQEANEALAGMLEELAELAPTAGADVRLVRLWLADWETYLGDREAYAAALAAGEDAELLVTPRAEEEGGGQITETIDHFAQINDMEDCQVPGDV